MTGSNPAVYSDPNSTGVTNLFTVAAGQTDTIADAGLVGTVPTTAWALNTANVTSYYSRNALSLASLVTTDAQGNVYVAGSLDGTFNFDRGAGTYNVTATGPGSFIAKYTSAGAIVWAKAFTGAVDGTDWTTTNAITVAPDGSVYLTGGFGHTTDFDPTASLLSLSAHTYTDAFVCKLDTYGNFLWAKNFGGTSAAEGYGIAIGSDGSVYTTGQFDGQVNFNPGAGTFNLSALPNQEDAYVSKLDPNGNFIWAKSFGGSGSVQGVSIAVGPDGSIYSAGNYSGTADFDLGASNFSLTSAGNDDVYVSKLTSSGSFVWAKSMGGSNYDDVLGMTVASDGSVYTTGMFSGTANFNPGSTAYNLTSNGGYDAFISKLDTNGNFVWAEHIGGANDDWGQNVSLGPDNSVYVAGEFSGTVNFNTKGTANLTSASTTGEDNFVLRLDSSGNYLWAGATGGSNSSDSTGRLYNLSESLAVAPDGSVYTAGQFETSANFNPSGTLTLSGTLSSGNDGFLAEFTAPTANFVAPVVTLSAPALTTSSTPSVTVTATESGSNMPNGTLVYLDVDLNNNGTFTDPGETAYAIGTLNNGTVTFNLTAPLPYGTYHLRAHVYDTSNNPGISAVSTMVVVTSPQVTLPALAATETVALTNVLLAHFDTFGSGGYSAVVTWGDGTANTTYTTAYSSTGYIVQHDSTNPGSGFDVYGSHTYSNYLTAATFSIQVTSGSTNISATNANFNVANQQLTNLASANLPTSGTKGTALAAITGLATFTDPSSNNATSLYTATINWGDATTSTGTIVSLGSGNYEVNAPAHTYAHSGQYAVNVTLQHQNMPALTTPNQLIAVGSTLPVVLSVTPSMTSGTLAFSGTTTLKVNFNMAMTNAGTASNFTLQSAGADGLLGTSDDVTIAISSASYANNTTTLTFPALPEGVYRLTVSDNITGGGVAARRQRHRRRHGRQLDRRFRGDFRQHFCRRHHL